MRAQLNRSRQSATEFAKLAVAGGRIANIANNDNKTKMKTTQNVTQPKSTTEDQWAAADKDVAATNFAALSSSLAAVEMIGRRKITGPTKQQGKRIETKNCKMQLANADELTSSEDATSSADTAIILFRRQKKEEIFITIDSLKHFVK
ncbi:unnamed protein product [Ceratitis capitata]|uniref:(Mediterranean fruit fly) hypothetical protein n=1 Tax=Ceratitis capitata TaxID=7213 RepID=A0A811VK88_CERCA|nr:unnamed protein product [Ceratitis capitata]